MPTIAQLYARNKRQTRQTAEAIKRRSFERQVEHIVESGLMTAEGKTLPERVHALLLSNRPGAAPELPAPILVEVGPGSFIGADDTPPAPTFQPIFDLIIATRRVAKFAGHTQSNDGKVLWIKRAGFDKQFPQRIHRLSDKDMQAKLSRYELVKQVANPTEIWHYYKLAIMQNQVSR